MLLWEIEKGLQKKSGKNDQQIVQFLPCLRGYCCFPIRVSYLQNTLYSTSSEI